MKLFALFMFLGFCTCHATVRAQDARIDLKMSDATLSQVFQKIEQLTEYMFIYKSEDIQAIELVTVDVSQMMVKDVLETCLKGTELSYIFKNNVIVIQKQTQEPEKKSIRVKGFVRDVNKHPIPGVTVKVIGVPVGTATDTRGWFSIELPVMQGKLEFSFVGFQTQAASFSEKTAKDTLRITLHEDVQIIDEVIVTGYQMIKEKAAVGSYSKVKASDLVMTGNETIESMLQGKIPGMVVTHASGLTGTRQKVRVRGTSTLIGNAEPVWVVDGVIQEDNLPFKSSELSLINNDNMDMMKEFIGGAVSWLNPNDIEDITVLKDASATAIYGVKAANGVILITTKKGERGRLSLNYAGNFSLSQRLNYNRMEIMNSKDRVALSREAFERGAKLPDDHVGYVGLAMAYMRKEISLEEFHTGVKKLETVNTDWFDILYRTPFSQTHSVSFSGGSHDATYRASFGYNNQQNTVKGNEQISYTGNLNVSTIFWDKLTLNASLAGSHIETKAFAEGVDPYGYAINTSRAIPCYDEGNLFYYEKDYKNYNILNELENSGNRNTLKSVNLNVSARWRFNETLTLSATLGGGSNSSFAEMWFTERSHNITLKRGYEYGEFTVTDDEYVLSQLPNGGMLKVSESRNFNYTARVQGEYVKLWNEVHSFNLMLGLETRSSKHDGYTRTDYGYMPDRGKSFAEVPLMYSTYNHPNKDYAQLHPTVVDSKSNYMSYYVTSGYMYDNRYSVNLSVRGDASNRFGSSSKFQTVWSAGLRWNVTDEHWMEGQELVNNLAFTASLGYQGNVVENVSPDFIAKYKKMDEKTGEWAMTWSSLPNPNLKPEKTMSVNFGAHFALLKNKLNGSFNWYYKKTSDLITTAKVPYETGTASMALNNGNVTNKGWDLALNVVPIRTKNFMWSLGTTFSGNDNSVKAKLASTGKWEEAVNGTLKKKGYPVGSFWAFRFDGLNPKNGAPMFDFSKADLRSAANDATEYMRYMGTIEPTFTLGINMVFRWKRFSFPLNFYVSRGNYTFLNSPYESGYSMLSEYNNASTQLNDRWREPGDEKNTSIPSIPVADNCRPLRPFGNSTEIYPLVAWAKSDARVVNAWFIRFNDLKFSYSLPEDWIKGFAKNITLSFTATNPLQIKSKDFKGRDPEVALGQQPRSQNFSFGINMSF